jgi:beta-aspartyl-peptidase (threonine type)
LLLASLLAAQTTAPANAAIAASAETTVATTAIGTELQAQVAAWNRGDLEGYMQGYWNSPQLTFFAGRRESAGWEAAYRRYRAAYLGKDKEMGKLEFSRLRIEVLSPETAFVRGAWQLTMKNGTTRRGLFTVVLKNFTEGWRIIHDHSS